MMETDAKAGIKPLDADRLFHVRVAEATGNSVLVGVVRRLFDARLGPLFDQLADAIVQWASGIAQIVGASKPRDSWPARRPDTASSEQRIEFGEVHIHHKQAITKRMFHRIDPSMLHNTFVETASHVRVSFGMRDSHTRKALTTPSSWKPLPQYAPQKDVRLTLISSRCRACAAAR